MLKLVEQNNGWEAKYQAALRELESRESQWQEIEALLRKAIGRLTTAPRGLDADLDKQLQVIQKLSREKRDEKLGQALEKLAQIIASLDKPRSSEKQRRSDPVLLMLELLQGIHFDAAQRLRLKSICSDLLKAVARGQERQRISGFVRQLSLLINENFDHIKRSHNTSEIIFQLIELLDFDDVRQAQFKHSFSDTREFHQQELEQLAALINAQLAGDSDTSSIDSVMTTLLERLAIVQGSCGDAQEIQERVHDTESSEEWTETLNDIVGSISKTLKKLNQEKRQLEHFIVNVTDQLGTITQVISEGHKDHKSDHQDTQSLHNFVQDGMVLIQKNFQATTDMDQLKSGISNNIDSIREGVDEFVSRINQRHEATEERNILLSQQLSQMEQETQELQVMLIENREKMLLDALTGVGSRHAYDEQIPQELARWEGFATPFAYTIIDVDHFKGINDQFGHNAGDKALKIISQVMLDNVRQSDFIFRIGGEEFVLIYPDSDASQANLLVEKLRQSIADIKMHFKKKPLRLTVSAGITESRTGDTVESIYERADKALYQAKNSGRDCQVVAD